MKILAVIVIIMALLIGLGLTCLAWAMAWMTFEDTRVGRAITEKIIERINK